MNIIFLGPQSSGKGTQAELLAKKLGLPIITTGEILRNKKASGDDEGRLIASFIDKGKLVPDELVDKIVRDELQTEKYSGGVIMDGYPRNLHQAETLEKFLNIDKVIFLDVPDGLVVKRMSARRVCKKCGANYNLISKPPKQEGVCDLCSSTVMSSLPNGGGELMRREDDTEEAIAVRLNIYHNETEPLIEHYRQAGKLIRIDGEGTIEEVRAEIENRI